MCLPGVWSMSIRSEGCINFGCPVLLLNKETNLKAYNFPDRSSTSASRKLIPRQQLDTHGRDGWPPLNLSPLLLDVGVAKRPSSIDNKQKTYVGFCGGSLNGKDTQTFLLSALLLSSRLECGHDG